MIIISRLINGITLNGVEYVMEYGEVKKFESRKHAMIYLVKTAGYTWDQIENEGIRFIYTNERGQCKCIECEKASDCFIKDKFQRHPPETTNGLGLGLCPKLKKEWTDQWTK